MLITLYIHNTLYIDWKEQKQKMFTFVRRHRLMENTHAHRVRTIPLHIEKDF